MPRFSGSVCLNRYRDKSPALAQNLAPKLFGKPYDALGLDKIKQLYDHPDTLVVQNPKPVDRLANLNCDQNPDDGRLN